MSESERWERSRVYWVGMRDLLSHVIVSGSGWPRRIRLLRWDGLPVDAYVDDEVYVNHEAKTFDFFVSHPSFDAVPHGDRRPRHPATGLHRWDIEVAEGEGSRAVVNQLERELSHYRRLFGDLRLDRPDVDDAYRRGLADAATVLYRLRDRAGDSVLMLNVPDAARDILALATGGTP